MHVVFYYSFLLSPRSNKCKQFFLFRDLTICILYCEFISHYSRFIRHLAVNIAFFLYLTNNIQRTEASIRIVEGKKLKCANCKCCVLRTYTHTRESTHKNIRVLHAHTQSRKFTHRMRKEEEAKESKKQNHVASNNVLVFPYFCEKLR